MNSNIRPPLLTPQLPPEPPRPPQHDRLPAPTNTLPPLAAPPAQVPPDDKNLVQQQIQAIQNMPNPFARMATRFSSPQEHGMMSRHMAPPPLSGPGLIRGHQGPGERPRMMYSGPNEMQRMMNPRPGEMQRMMQPATGEMQRLINPAAGSRQRMPHPGFAPSTSQPVSQGFGLRQNGNGGFRPQDFPSSGAPMPGMMSSSPARSNISAPNGNRMASSAMTSSPGQRAELQPMFMMPPFQQQQFQQQQPMMLNGPPDRFSAFSLPQRFPASSGNQQMVQQQQPNMTSAQQPMFTPLSQATPSTSSAPMLTRAMLSAATSTASRGGDVKRGRPSRERPLAESTPVRSGPTRAAVSAAPPAAQVRMKYDMV